MNIFCVSQTYVAGFSQGKGEMDTKLCANSIVWYIVEGVFLNTSRLAVFCYRYFMSCKFACE